MGAYHPVLGKEGELSVISVMLFCIDCFVTSTFWVQVGDDLHRLLHSLHHMLDSVLSANAPAS
eukprot:4850905-Amphidinium_carterae.1